MSTLPQSLSRDLPTSRQLVDRIIDDTALAEAVQDLPARSLGKLIDHVGLEDSGEIIALATAEQIERIFDDDLWRSERPGTEERFDSERFVLWLGVMMGVGEAFAAEAIESFPEDLVLLALQRNILVIDIDALGDMIAVSNDTEIVDKALDSSPRIEFEEFMVIARRHDGWDAIEALLAALNEHNHPFLCRLLSRCAAISAGLIEDNGGLYDVLSLDRMLASDLAAAREDRRELDGFVAPAQAASFLGLCRMTDPDAALPLVRDPVTSAHFRRFVAADDRPPPSRRAEALTLEALIGRLTDIVGEAKAPAPRLLASKPDQTGEDRRTLFERTLAELGERNPALEERRRDELAYIGNALVAGCTLANRPFRPCEAVMAAVAICNIGLEYLTSRKGPTTATRLMESGGADSLFRVGFSILHRDIVMTAAAVVTNRLEDATRDAMPGKERERLVAVSGFAERLIATGKPWHILPHLDAFPELFRPSESRSLFQLLGECPLLSGTLVAGTSERYRIGKDRHFLLGLDDVAAAKAFLSELRQERSP